MSRGPSSTLAASGPRARLRLAVVIAILACGCAKESAFDCRPCAQDLDCRGGETCRQNICVADGQDPARCPRPTSNGSSGGASGSTGSSGSNGSSGSIGGSGTGGTSGGELTVSGLADDPDWTRTKSFTPTCSAGSCTWRYRVDEVQTGGFSTEPYVALDTIVIDADPTQPEVPSGTHYLHVQARDGADHESAVVSVSFKIDVTPPSVPTNVVSSPAGNIPSSHPALAATWAASTDAESGLAGYEAAVVRLDDDQPVRGWWPVSSGAPFPAISGLEEGNYAVAVRARDAVGNVSAPGPGARFTLAYSGGDAYSDDPNVGVRVGLPSLGQGLYLVPTFHSVGVYWAVPGGASDVTASVKFRPAGSTAWRNGHDLWFDPRNQEYRGSLVILQPGTPYEVEASLSSGTSVTGTVSTWSESFPIARTIALPAGTSAQNLNITESGTPDGYVLYTADPAGSTIDQGFTQGARQNCVDVHASYVIIRGLTLRNCQQAGVEIHAGAHDVVIEQNDISGFGFGSGGAIQGPTDQVVPGEYEQAGVFCKMSAGDAPRPFRIIVQRNRIHDPRYGSISWGYAHPNSANAIFFGHCGGNNVFRFNDVSGQIGHYFGDGIGGSDNDTYEGFPDADSDIYGNRISDCYDDAIEADGANRNVRIWGNYLHHVFNGISQAANSVGPAYTFRNVVNETGGMYNPVADTPDQEDRAELAKVGSSDTGLDNAGRLYIFHNTTLQPNPPAGSGLTLPMGVGGGITHAAGPAYEVVSRNNILWIWKSWWESIALDGTSGFVDANYDLYNGVLTGVPAETNGINGTPTFNVDVDPHLTDATLPDSGTQYRAGRVYLGTADPSVAGDFTLAPASLGFHAGQPIPNFNDGYAQPDMGAHQSGSPPMQFGVNAYPSGFPQGY